MATSEKRDYAVLTDGDCIDLVLSLSDDEADYYDRAYGRRFVALPHGGQRGDLVVVDDDGVARVVTV